MKIFKHFSFILVAALIFVACTKEISLESGIGGGNAVGSLASSAGQCAATEVHGEFVRDSVVNDSNFVVVKVNFQSPGLYKILTETENGFSFYDSGYMINSGLQDIKLKAIGRPIAKGNTSFLVTLDTSFCSFTVPVADTPNTHATVRLDSASGCGMLIGTYRVGMPLNPNTEIVYGLKMQANRAGTYSLTTQPRNGMVFKASGTFTNIGLQSVVLRGSGTPVTAGPDTIKFIVSGDTCSYFFTVLPDTTVIIPPPTAADSAWSFFQGSSFFYGPIDSAKIDSFPFITLSGLVTVPGVGVWGSSYATADSTFFVGIPLNSAGGVDTGSYHTNSLTMPAAFRFYKTPNTVNVIYTASFLNMAVPGVDITVRIISYNSATKIITGTVTGTATTSDVGSTLIPITNGKFTAKVR